MNKKVIVYLLFICVCNCTVIAQVNLRAGLVGEYNFSSNSFDSSGYNHNATLAGGIYTDDRFGNPTCALRLRGNGEYVEFPKIITLENPAWTFSIWFKLEKLPKTLDDAFLLTYKDILIEQDVHLYVDNDDNAIKLYRADTGNKPSSYVVVIKDVWYQVVLTSGAGNDLKLYVNGQLKLNQNVNFSSGGNSILISSNYAGNNMQGRVWGVVDAVRFYDRAISASEALALYQSIEGDTICGSVTGLFDIKFPNVFTPNMDGENDTFKIIGNNIISMEIKIYNLWGEIVFESNDINNAWDGKSKNGVDVPQSTYYYIAELKVSEYSMQETKVFKGAVSLIRNYRY
jgi:gliding motility-associated-like protein